MSALVNAVDVERSVRLSTLFGCPATAYTDGMVVLDENLLFTERQMKMIERAFAAYMGETK